MLLCWPVRDPMPVIVTAFAWAIATVQVVTLLVLIWAMVVEGPRLLQCITGFVGE